MMGRLCALAVPALVATIDELERGVVAFAAQPETGASLAPKLRYPFFNSPMPPPLPMAR